ncbi:MULTISPECIES: hypothetical protein [Rhodomicrobium]|uniref:hypothetical protein n=1 Tax=Rhodomicrobium TaxID=1068 RepID=UPI000B4B5379|nr:MULTISPECIES: hypothetical protein [Rhodomicrobium]
MRSFRKLAALSATGAAYLFLGLPASAATVSLWDHNGSLVRLEENGKKRTFSYDQPKAGLTPAGIKPGAVLFEGEEKSDGRLSGYAKLFRKGCDPVDYFVEGGFDKEKGELLLQGQAPVYSAQGCKITGYSEEGPSSSLIFRYQSGGAAPVARNEYPPVNPRGRSGAYDSAPSDDARGRSGAYSAAPSDEPRGRLSPYDAAPYGDSRDRSASTYGTVPPEDLRDRRPAPYGTVPPEDIPGARPSPYDRNPSAAAPAPAEDDPYADPRDTQRYGTREYPPRDYADQQDRARRRYDGAYPVPADPEDADDEAYSDDDDRVDEPAYRPYRRWGQPY